MEVTTPPTAGDLPHWDMTPIFPALDSPEFAAAFAGAVAGIHDLQATFDRYGVASVGPDAPPADDKLVEAFEAVTGKYNALLDTMRVIGAYISSFIATDSRHADAQAKSSELRRERVALGILGTRHTAWLGSIDTDGLLARSQMARDHAYYIHEAKVAATHLLTPGEEALVGDLSLSGGGAWAKLYSDITSQLTVPLNGGEQPMSVIRALASDADAATRKGAYEAELGAWERNALPLCAAMNAIKHESNTMATRRGWGETLDSAVFGNHIDRPTLDAMLSAARKSFPDFRRYLRAKARVISGAERLPWYDLFAPMPAEPGAENAWSWPDAEAFIATHFGSYSDRMRDFALRAFREKWIDAEPRPGKSDGAFCMGVRRGESRILQNYKPAFGGVSTLAHELGHGYHNLCLEARAPLQGGTPMTLAETASIFCETIIRRAALKEASPQEQLIILEAALQGQCQVVVDITSRFLFEQNVMLKRRDRELSADEMCQIMREAQGETYGDGLDDAYLHPYMWAAKGHYYGSSFYNYPYMFGLLFALGLYAQYTQDPDTFRARYDDLLSRTGMATAADLAADFGIDIRDEAFWTASLDTIREDIARFEKLVG